MSDEAARRALLVLALGDRQVHPDVLEELTRRGLVSDGLALSETAMELVGLDDPSRHEARGYVRMTRVLHRVLPVCKETTTPTGDRVVVSSAELWSDAVVVTWTTIGIDFISSTAEGGRRRASSWLVDDTGSTFREDGVSGGGDRCVCRWTSYFRGSIHPDATRVLFTPGVEAGGPVGGTTAWVEPLSDPVEIDLVDPDGIDVI